MDSQCDTIHCRQLAAFEMKTDSKVFQLQNRISHAMSLLEGVRQGASTVTAPALGMMGAAL